MKKITLFFLSLAVTASLFAQTAEEALNFAQEYYEGTARTMAMGNAFTALGGDLGAIGINPASSGVMNCSQFAFSPSLTTSRSNTNYLGNNTNARNTGFTVSSLGAVINFDTGRYTGLVNYNFGFVFNKKNNFRSVMQVSGTTNNSSMLSSLGADLEGFDWHYIDLDYSDDPYTATTASWPGIIAYNAYALRPLSDLGGKYANVNDSYIASTENYDEATDQLRIGGPLDQRFNRKTRGSNEEFSFNFGTNFSDRFYVGVNLNFLTLTQTTEEFYEEKAQNSYHFDDGFVKMDNSYWLRTVGTGFNAKVGFIVAPVAGLRLGATITTPTWYRMRDEWDYTMNTAFDNGNTNTIYTPTGTYTYNMTAPMRWSVGAAYTFWDRGLISVDYEGVNYASTRLYEYRSTTPGVFADEDQRIAQSFQRAGILRVGAEIRVLDFISLRGGYQNYSPAIRGNASRNGYSAGIGFAIGQQFSIDLAWTRLASQSDSFQLYDNYSSAVTVPQGINTQSQNKIVCTVGFKF